MNYEDDYYQNSLCLEGLWLHDYYIVKEYQNGSLERCRKCRDSKFFKNNGSNKYYLSYHIRSCLRPDQKRFKKEYKNEG